MPFLIPALWGLGGFAAAKLVEKPVVVTGQNSSIPSVQELLILAALVSGGYLVIKRFA